jgi:hypothetical protein
MRHFPYGFLISLFLEVNERGSSASLAAKYADIVSRWNECADEGGPSPRTIFENHSLLRAAIHGLFILPLKVVTARLLAGKARSPYPDSLPPYVQGNRAREYLRSTATGVIYRFTFFEMEDALVFTSRRFLRTRARETPLLIRKRRL